MIRRSWFVLAALTGASGPNIGSLVRARWADTLEDAVRAVELHRLVGSPPAKAREGEAR